MVLPPSAGVSLTEADGRLVMRCTLPAPRAPLTLAALRTLIGEAGFGSRVLSERVLSELIERWNSEPGAFEHLLVQGEDARCDIEVDRSGHTAWVTIHPSSGGLKLEPDAVLQALAKAHVVHGIDVDALRQACEADLPARVVAASATPAVDGADTRFELLVADTRDRSPKVDEFGHIDFHQLGDIPVVKAGQPLMRRHPATPGRPGRTVRGETIPARPGHDLPFDTRLAGSRVDAKDPNLLVATVTGQPVHTDTGVQVEQILRLRNVSMASGNISFDGTIEIDEDVQPGMTVKATGDVVVKGTIEGARVESEGNVQVGGGIIARAVVRAGHAVTARFAENVEIHAGAVISIADMAIHCTLEANNQILVGSNEAHRGRLVGGVARATMRVQAPTLGAPAGGVTRVQVGIHPELDQRLKELAALMDRQKADEDKLGKAVKHLQQHGDPRQLLPKLQAAWQQTLAAWGASLEEHQRIEAERALTANARVDVLSGVDGDVDLVFGASLLRRVRQNLRPGSFTLTAEGKVVYTDEGGHVTGFG